MKKVIFMTPGDAENGFQLAGVSQYITSAEKAEQKLLEAVKETDAGLIIIDERLLHDIHEESLKKIEARWSGTMLILPSPAPVKAAEEDYAARLIRHAIGYHVRLGI